MEVRVVLIHHQMDYQPVRWTWWLEKHMVDLLDLLGAIMTANLVPWTRWKAFQTAVGDPLDHHAGGGGALEWGNGSGTCRLWWRWWWEEDGSPSLGAGVSGGQGGGGAGRWKWQTPEVVQMQGMESNIGGGGGGGAGNTASSGAGGCWYRYYQVSTLNIKKSHMAPLRSLGNVQSAFDDFYARTGKDAVVYWWSRFRKWWNKNTV